MRLSGEDLETALRLRSVSLGIAQDDWEALQALAAPLKAKNEVTRFHYEHSGRVALKASEIGEFVHLDPRALFYAGFAHDLGKCLVPRDTLGKTSQWNSTDYRTIRRHVTDSYGMLRDRFDFTAAVVLWHHRFQENGYPRRLPKPLHRYSRSSLLLIAEFGRMLAVADVYDALHRANSKFGVERALSTEEIKVLMLKLNPDRQKLVEDLYDAGILGEGK